MSRLDEYNARRAHKRPKPTRTAADLHHDKADGQPCRRCGSRARVEAHHIVHRGRIGGSHPLVHHADNGIPLCHDCHQAHHTTAHGRIPRGLLTVPELAFALCYGGHGWLSKWYPETKGPR